MESEKMDEMNGFRDSLTERETSLSPHLIGTARQTSAVFAKSCSGGVTVDVGGGLRWSWGGKNGGEGSVYFNGQAQGNNGSRATVEAEHKSDGTGNVSVSGGYKGQIGGNKTRGDKK